MNDIREKFEAFLISLGTKKDAFDRGPIFDEDYKEIPIQRCWQSYQCAHAEQQAKINTLMSVLPELFTKYHELRYPKNNEHYRVTHFMEALKDRADD